MARAGDYGLRVEEDAIPVQPVIRRTAEVFKFDPFCAISEGTLIAIVDPKDSDKVVKELIKNGISGAVVGEVVDKEKGHAIVKDGKERVLEHPKVDPYWVLAAEFSK